MILINLISRYKYKNYSPTWETIPITTHIFGLLSQFTHQIEVTYLPVYFPSNEELLNPQKYADNVQKVYFFKNKK